MIFGKNGKLVVENGGPGVRVLRFIHPDLRDQAYEGGDIERSRLFLDIKTSALGYISEREILIVNMALIEHFPTVLYSILLKVREILTAHRGGVILCGANAHTREILDLFKASRLFAVVKTEEEALELGSQYNGRLLPMPDVHLPDKFPEHSTS
jgi:anti-anti-sigma regulatory factor